METNITYSPHDLLPAKEPKVVDANPYGFYDDVAKHLIKDTVRIMNNGLPIDLRKVKELETTLDEVLKNVELSLGSNPLIIQFQEIMYKQVITTYVKKQKEKFKKPSEFVKEFDYKKSDHRAYFMFMYSQDHGLQQPEELLPTGVPKWPARLVNKISAGKIVLKQLMDGKLTEENNDYVRKAMKKLAEDKANIYNKRYKDNISTPKVELPKFNPASSKQKQELFAWLKIPSEVTSKTTGLPSYSRDQIERINKQTTDESIKNLTQAMIDHSFGAIVKNNFINAFYEYTVEGRLYGTYKLFGAKSFRYTSSNPNMLNQPSTGSIYAKPIKRCFTAPEGFLIYAIDYSALEDRVIASLTRDTNKCNIFLEGLDGHCLNAYGYFKEEIAQHMTLTGDTNTDVKEFFRLVEDGHKELKAIRQKGKPATFGLSYGAFPKKVAQGLKVPIDVAESIFDRYHNELYSGITDYRENYVLPTARDAGSIHMGLGCRIMTDDPDADIRTLNNATCQFWSILTALAINKIHQAIDEAGLEEAIQCTSTIYDSIYFIVQDDPATIKWLNDRIVKYMMVDFMENQTVINEATGEIGHDWADLHQIPNGASEDEIKRIIDEAS